MNRILKVQSNAPKTAGTPASKAAPPSSLAPKKHDGIKRPLPPGHYIDDTTSDIFTTDKDFEEFDLMLEEAKQAPVVSKKRISSTKKSNRNLHVWDQGQQVGRDQRLIDPFSGLGQTPL